MSRRRQLPLVSFQRHPFSRRPSSRRLGATPGTLAAVSLILAVACGGDDDPMNPDPDDEAAITVSPPDFALIEGGQITLEAEVLDDDGDVVSNPTVDWSSSNPSALAVSGSGGSVTITAAGTGSATITATSGSLSDDAPGVAVASATFSGDVQPIFTGNCALSGCHTEPDPQQGQDLSAGEAYANIVNVPSMGLPTMDRIEPGDPLQSYLVHKIRGTHLQVGGTGVRMPFEAPPLADGMIDVIRAWVQAGAPEN